MRHRTKEDREYQRWTEARQEHKYVCKHCGHKQLITAWMDKNLCDWCKNYVFKSDKDEFKYRMQERLKKVRK